MDILYQLDICKSKRTKHKNACKTRDTIVLQRGEKCNSSLNSASWGKEASTKLGYSLPKKTICCVWEKGSTDTFREGKRTYENLKRKEKKSIKFGLKIRLEKEKFVLENWLLVVHWQASLHGGDMSESRLLHRPQHHVCWWWRRTTYR